MSDQRQSKAGKPASPRPRWEAATEPSPGEKGRMGKKKTNKIPNLRQRIGPRGGTGGSPPARLCPGFKHAQNNHRKQHREPGGFAYGREGREMPGRLFGQGLPSSGCNS